MYSFDEKLIHDNEAMWDLALSFERRYKFVKEQILKIDKYTCCINYNGNLIFKYSDEKAFKKAIRDYKKELEFMEFLFKRDSKIDNPKSYTKYLSED